MKKAPSPRSRAGKKSPAKSADPAVAALVARIEVLAIESYNLKKSLDLARKQVDMHMDRAIAAEGELEKAQLSVKNLTESVDVLKREIADFRSQLAAPKKP